MRGPNMRAAGRESLAAGKLRACELWACELWAGTATGIHPGGELADQARAPNDLAERPRWT